jgi:MFS family permease
MLAVASSPYIVTTWVAGPINDNVVRGPGWRWGVGVWAIVTPIVVAPLCILFIWAHQKSKKLGIITSSRGKLTPQAVWKYIIDVDLLGIIILAGGMSLFLLPFSLYSYQGDGWRSPMIICMIIFGALLIIAFVLYEKFLAPVPFIPFSLLTDRTVFFGGLMLTFVFFNSMVWGSFFTSMLLVVWNQAPSQATYISNIYRTGSCFAGLPIGYLIRRTRRFKWVALYYALPLMTLGVGLLIYFRQPDSPIGYVIMTQIFIAFAGGPIVLAAEMAMMAPSDHQHIAVLIAILDLFCSVGTAVGSTVSSAIWTGTFRTALERHLPPNAPLERIYASLYSQLGFRPGTEIRDSISLAYGDSQRYMLITSVCALGGAIICVFFWRDIKLDAKQVKGYVV